MSGGYGSAASVRLLWFLPAHGDSYFLGIDRGARTTDLAYFGQLAQAADTLGYYGVLVPTGESWESSWLVAAAMVPLTRRLRFLVAVRPGLQPPTLIARMAATLDRLSEGRALINVVAGGDPAENFDDDSQLGHAERYQLTSEFLTVYRRLLAGETVDFIGRHFQVDGAQLPFAPVQEGGPPLWFGGSSAEAGKIAAATIDKYLTWGDPPVQVAEKIAAVRALAAARGRRISFGVRLHIVVRRTVAAAWAAADELIEHVSDAAIARAQQVGRRDGLKVGPNPWPGLGLLHEGAGTALVGDPETVAQRMQEYMALGIDSFILSGHPHLEEAYRFAELVMPLLPLAHEGPRRRIRAVNTRPGSAVLPNSGQRAVIRVARP